MGTFGSLEFVNFCVLYLILMLIKLYITICLISIIEMRHLNSESFSNTPLVTQLWSRELEPGLSDFQTGALNTAGCSVSLALGINEMPRYIYSGE